MEGAIADKAEGRIVTIAAALGESGLAAALPILQRALGGQWDDATYNLLVAAIGSIANPVNPDKAKAGFGILDRAGTETAAKGTVVESGTKRVSFDVSGLPTDVLKLIANAGK
jgi:hypothetical protein